MKNKKIEIQNILKIFHLKILNPKEANLKKEINNPAIQRMGLELSGFDTSTKFAKNIIGWGTKEYKWFKNLKKEKAKKAINNVLSNNVPAIILSVGMKGQVIDWIIEECSKKNISVLKSNSHLSSINSTIGWHLINKFADSINIHGSLVIINGVGVMIVGKSGIGKSEAVIELIQMGHSFVSDDTIIVKKIGKQFMGLPSKLTKGLLEARGIGLINIPYIYGQKSIKNSARIELVVELVSREQLNKVDRLGNQNLKYNILDYHINKIQIPVHHGRSVADLIEAATNVYLARKSGINPIELIQKRRN